jgi:hypothetical protein
MTGRIIDEKFGLLFARNAAQTNKTKKRITPKIAKTFKTVILNFFIKAPSSKTNKIKNFSVLFYMLKLIFTITNHYARLIL